MLSGALVDYLSRSLDTPANSIQSRLKPLRAAQMLSKHGRGPNAGARMTSRDAVIATWANALEIRRGANVGATVREAFNQPEFHKYSIPDDDLMIGLKCVTASFAGTCLEWLLDDVRSGRMAKWAKGEKVSVSAILESRGRALTVFLSLPDGGHFRVRSISLCYGVPKIKEPAVRKIEFHTEFFTELAKALGPPT